jgi:glucokinase
MKNLTLSIDEQLLEKARKYAAEHSTTVNQMVRDFLKDKIGNDKTCSVKSGFQIAEQAGASSGGWKFNREEIYAERMAKLWKR